MTLPEFLTARIAEDGSEARGNLGDYYQSQNAERMLLEIEAKKQIMALHFEMDGGAPVWPACAVCHEGSPARPHCDTVRILAAIYADHPDFQDEWRL